MNSNDMPYIPSPGFHEYEAFCNFYEECCREAFDKPFPYKETPTTISYKGSRRINYLITIINKRHESIVEEISPKIHQYIRTHGIPVSFLYPFSYRSKISVASNDFDDSVPFSEKEVYIQFQFCGPTCDYEVDRNFTDYEERDNCIVLKPNLRRPTYTPPMSENYDSEFHALRDKEKRIRQKIERCSYHLTETQNVLAGLNENRFANARSTLYSFIVCLVLSAATAFGTFIILALFSSFILGIEIGFMPLFAQIIVGLIVAAVFCCILFNGWKTIILPEFIEKPKARQKAQKDIEQTEHEIASEEKELADLIESDTYHRAKQRNLMAYESDCQLAKEWQNQWYSWCCKHPEYFCASGSSVNYKE